MRSPEEVFYSLARMYDFYREIARFEVKATNERAELPETDSNDSDRPVPAAGD
jgi:hypothetical protein